MPGYFGFGFYEVESIPAEVQPPVVMPTGAEDLMGALKAVWSSSPECVASAPGGWHSNEGAVGGLYPYVTAKRISGMLKRRSSTSNVDDVMVRVRVWSNELGNARLAANAIETKFLSLDGLLWSNGWSTRLERVDRTEDKGPGRAPGAIGVLRMVDISFLTHCGRPA
jgi:hypothetical protein